MLQIPRQVHCRCTTVGRGRLKTAAAAAAAAATAAATASITASSNAWAATPRYASCEATAHSKPPSTQKVLVSPKSQDWVELNSDKTQNYLVNTDSVDWTGSPAPGVYRKLIERLGGETARCTTVVRFDPYREFPAHTHGGGEEFLVLEGSWHDEWGDQPKYTYVRNYIDSRHTPRIGPTGCTIVVRLRQMAHEHKEPEHRQWDISTANSAWEECVSIPGRKVLRVYVSPNEEVRFERWAPGARGVVDIPLGGEEVFTAEGSFMDELGDHRRWSWARNADFGTRLRVAGSEGCLLYVKSRHLSSPEVGVSTDSK